MLFRDPVDRHHTRKTRAGRIQTELFGPNRVLRYRAVVGDARLWFSFTLTAENEIAQIYWW